MGDSLTIILGIFGSSTFCGIITLILTRIFKKIDEKYDKTSGQSAGLQWILQDRLDFLMSRAIVEGYTTVQEKSRVERGFKLYCALGTEDGIKTLKDRYDTLPVELDPEQLRSAKLAARSKYIIQEDEKWKY